MDTPKIRPAFPTPLGFHVGVEHDETELEEGEIVEALEARACESPPSIARFGKLVAARLAAETPPAKMALRRQSSLFSPAPVTPKDTYHFRETPPPGPVKKRRSGELSETEKRAAIDAVRERTRAERAERYMEENADFFIAMGKDREHAQLAWDAMQEMAELSGM